MVLQGNLTSSNVIFPATINLLCLLRAFFKLTLQICNSKETKDTFKSTFCRFYSDKMDFFQQHLSKNFALRSITPRMSFVARIYLILLPQSKRNIEVLEKSKMYLGTRITQSKLGKVVHACNPSTPGGRGRKLTSSSPP